MLVVEDHDDTREAIVRVLRSAGHHAIGVSSCDDTLALLRAGLRPALLILDLMMPGMTGWQFRAAQLSEPAIADIPVVFVSALSDTLHAIQGGAAPGAAAIEKPVDPDELLGVVARVA